MQQQVLRGMIYTKYKNAAEFARDLQWRPQKLSLIVTGKREPTLSDVSSMSAHLGVSVESLFNLFLPEQSPNG